MKPLVRILAVSLALCAPLAHADDSDWGCEVLICLSNPQGPTAVSQCVAPIKKLWRALWKGNPFPTCFMGGGSGGYSAQNKSANVSNCPPQYIRTTQDEYPTRYCMFAGVITTMANGQPAARTWWTEGDSVTEYLGPTKAQAGDSRFDDDRAAYDAGTN